MDAMVGETLFLDTNVLLTATDRRRPLHNDVHELFATADSRGFHIALSGQVLREYLAVATRPVDSNGLGLAVSDAIANLESFLEFAKVFDETEAVARRLREIASTCGVYGKHIHDANIVATMQVHQISVLVTQNRKDFARFMGIKVLSIEEISSSTMS